MPLQPEQLHLNFYLGINFGKEKKAKDSAFEMFFVEEGVGVGPVNMETLCTSQFVVNVKLLYKMQFNDFFEKGFEVSEARGL